VFYSKPAASAENVKLYLQWFHPFQFTGYYAALEKGFFQEEELKVVQTTGAGQLF
jgi:ABC-type nitrate/sulfonate/bicarbonate transport system substrate-binding protein